MDRENQTKVLLLATLAGAGLLYALTAANGYPWSASTHWALAWSGVLGELPVMAHPVWGYFVRIFDGHYIAMSVMFTALTCAVVAAVVTRHFGWRVGTAAALFGVFTPFCWNVAVTGGMSAFQLLLAALVLAAVDVVGTAMWRRFQLLNAAKNATTQTLSTGGSGKWERIAAWSTLVVAVVFMIVSLSQHDYAIGEDATEYVEGVLKDADGKWVVLSGVADDQFYAAVRDGKFNVTLVSLRRDDINRRQLIERVRRTFPDEPELVAAAEIGPQAFVAAARRSHPDLFLMADMERTRKIIEDSGNAERMKRRDLPIEKLVEWNNEMVQAMNVGDGKKAGAIAREILSHPQWRGFVPANAILGTLSGLEGDFAASERFFRAVFASGIEQPTVAYNDFAETLRQLNKYAEAEKFAREAVAKAGPKDWMARFTLIQILHDAGKDGEELQALVAEVLKYAPVKVRARIREYKKPR